MLHSVVLTCIITMMCVMNRREYHRAMTACSSIDHALYFSTSAAFIVVPSFVVACATSTTDSHSSHTFDDATKNNQNDDAHSNTALTGSLSSSVLVSALSAVCVCSPPIRAGCFIPVHCNTNPICPWPCALADWMLPPRVSTLFIQNLDSHYHEEIVTSMQLSPMIAVH